MSGSKKRDCCSIHIELENKGTVNIFNCPPFGDSQPPGPAPEQPCPKPPETPPIGACIPVTAGHKPKRALTDRLRPLIENSRVPSVLPAAFFRLARRYLRGHAPANELEQRAFAVLAGLSPAVRAVLACALETVDSLPEASRDELFPAELISGEDPLTSTQLEELLTAELRARTSIEAFGHEDCLDVERPGLARPGPGIEANEVFFVPTICKVDGLRTSAYQPPLTLGELRTEELQQVCVPETVDGEVRVNCSVQTADCPGNALDGTCLRVPEVRPGDAVILEGVNFYNVEGRVRLTAKEPGTVVREVEAHVCGDLETPLTETVDGQEWTIRDCRVHDQLSFKVPEDLPEGIYGITVIMPNNTGVGPITEFTSFGFQYINVIPPPTAIFQIASERLHAIEETSPAFLGSDEIGIRILAIPIGPDLSPGEVVESNFRFDDVDSGERRNMDRVLIREAGLAGISLAIIGFEIDSEDAFEQQIREFSDAYVLILESNWKAVIGGISGLGKAAALALGLSAAWAAAIAAAITLAITIFVALWAPADLIIEDAASLTVLELGARTSPNFPAPAVLEYTTAGDIDVKVEAVDKGAAEYREQRDYRSDGEGSHYRITLRYTRS